MDQDTRDRVIRLEAELQHMNGKLEKMETALGKLATQLSSIESMFTQAEGARKTLKFLIFISSSSVVLWLAQFWEVITKAFHKG